MKVISTTNARKNIKTLVDRVKYRGESFAIGRRNSIDAILVQFPQSYNKDLNYITNINTYSKSFDFLRDEPDLYSAADVKGSYA